MMVWRLWPEAPTQMLHAALFHDVAECITGDVPANAKWDYPKLAQELQATEQDIYKKWGLLVPEIEPSHKEVLKWADGLELMHFCSEEVRMGNSTAAIPFYRILENLSARPVGLTPLNFFKEAKRMLKCLKEEMDDMLGPMAEEMSNAAKDGEFIP